MLNPTMSLQYLDDHYSILRVELASTSILHPAGKALHGHELTNMRDLEASIAEEQRVYMLAAHRLGMFSYKKELESCRPEILSHLEVRQLFSQLHSEVC